MAHGAFAYDYTQDANAIISFTFDTNASPIVDSTDSAGGAVSGATWNASGLYGGDYSFAGVSDYINFTQSTSNTQRTVFSFKTSIGGTVLGITSSGNSFSIFSDIEIITATGYLKINQPGSTSGVFHVATDYRDGVKHSVYIARKFTNGSLPIVYVDGASQTVVQDTSLFGADGSFGTAGYIGCGIASGTRTGFFTGEIDEIEFFSRDLTPTEITDIYTNGLKGSTPPSGGQMTTNSRYWGN